MDRLTQEHISRESRKFSRRMLCYGLGQAAGFAALIALETYFDSRAGYSIATAVFALGSMLAAAVSSVGWHGSSHFSTIVCELMEMRYIIGHLNSMPVRFKHTPSISRRGLSGEVLRHSQIFSEPPT